MKTKNRNILHLTLKKEFFDQITCEEKTSEFREYKTYWIKRLMEQDGSFKQIDFVHFRNGYSKNAPELLVECLGIILTKQRIGFLKREKVFEIKLGEVLEIR